MVSKLRIQHPSFIPIVLLLGSIVWLLHSVCLHSLPMLCNMVGLAYNLTKRGREREGPGGVVWGRWGRKWGSHWWHSNDGFFLLVMWSPHNFAKRLRRDTSQRWKDIPKAGFGSLKPRKKKKKKRDLKNVLKHYSQDNSRIYLPHVAPLCHQFWLHHSHD